MLGLQDIGGARSTGAPSSSASVAIPTLASEEGNSDADVPKPPAKKRRVALVHHPDAA